MRTVLCGSGAATAGATAAGSGTGAGAVCGKGAVENGVAVDPVGTRAAGAAGAAAADSGVNSASAAGVRCFNAMLVTMRVDAKLAVSAAKTSNTAWSVRRKKSHFSANFSR